MRSVYDKLKKNEKYNGTSGKEELKYLYYYPKPPVGIQVLLSNDLIDNIVEISKNKDQNVYLNINDVPLVCYSDVLMEKLNTFVKEEIISEEWLREFTSNLIYEGEDVKGVQLGLILSERYIENEKLSDIVEVFSKDSDYVFYLLKSIKKLPKCNSFLLDLAKKSNGTIKVFAVTNLEVLNSDIRDYLIEEGYKDETQEALLINYIITTVNIDTYMKGKELHAENVNKLSYLLQSYLRYTDGKVIMDRQKLISDFVDTAVNKGDNIYTLYALVLILNKLKVSNEPTAYEKDIVKKIKTEINDEKWREVFKSSLGDYSIPSFCIIDIGVFYGVKIKLTELIPYLNISHRDIGVFEYICTNGTAEERIQLFQFFNENFNIDDLTKKAEDIPTESLNSNFIDDMILFYIIKSLSKIYSEGRSLAFKALKAKINDSRFEAINILERYESLTKKEIGIIKEAMEKEPCKIIENKMRALIEDKNAHKKEFISTDKLEVVSFVDDIYLLTTTVAGSGYRNQAYLQDELETSRRYYLTLEKDNPYDENAVIIVGESGYVVGYVPKEQNTILSNLLKNGKYLYAKIQEYNLSEAYIKIKIYLSLKDVLDYCQDTINLLGLPEGDMQ